MLNSQFTLSNLSIVGFVNKLTLLFTKHLWNEVSPAWNDKSSAMRNKEVINLDVNGLIILLSLLYECFESEMKEAASAQRYENAASTSDFEDLSCCSGNKVDQSLLRGKRKSWAHSKLSTKSTVTRLSPYEDRDPDVKPACAVTTPVPSNIKVSCSRYCGSSHLTISAIAHSNGSTRNNPPTHPHTHPFITLIDLLCIISDASVSAARRVWSSRWAALLI